MATSSRVSEAKFGKRLILSDTIHLLYSTGESKIDEIIRGIIGITELIFPEQVRGYYLTGSYGNGSAVASSDLDLCVIFKGETLQTNRERLRKIYDCCGRISSISLDIVAYSEVEIREGGRIWLRKTQWLFGDDIRATVPQLPLVDYVRIFMHAPYSFFARARNQIEVLTFPLDHPDPIGAWLGYDRRHTRTLDGRDVPGTHELLTGTFWSASALILRRSGVFAHGKQECVKLYRTHINDEWSDLLETIYQKCRIEWLYFIPDSPADQRLLRDLCHQALAFHNHFLTQYKDFLLTDLQSKDASAQLLAAQRLGKILYPDQQVFDKLSQLHANQNADLTEAVQTALRRIRSILVE